MHSALWAQVDYLNHTYLNVQMSEDARVLTYQWAYDAQRSEIYGYNRENAWLIAIKSDLSVDSLLQLPVNRLKMALKPEGDALLFWDEGGGRVFKFDLDAQKLQRIDQSFAFKAFYNHASVLLPHESIHLLGGYGLFTEKNTLIYFDKAGSEWQLAEATSNELPKKIRGKLVYHEASDSFYYFHIGLNQLIVYFLDTERMWRPIAHFPTDQLQFYLGIESIRVDGTYALDQKRDIIHLASGLFYDITQNHLVDCSTLPDYPNSVFDQRLRTGQFFYDKGNDQWVVIGQSTNSAIKLATATYTWEQLMARPLVTYIQPIPTWRLWMAEHPRLMTYLGLALFLLPMWIGYFWLKRHQKKRAPSKAMVGMPSSFNGLEINQLSEATEDQLAEEAPQPESAAEKLSQLHAQSTDPLEQKMYALMLELHQQGVKQIALKDFDQRLFNGNADAAQSSRTRMKLLEIMRKRHGKELVQIKKNPVDRRYKVLEFNVLHIIDS